MLLVLAVPGLWPAGAASPPNVRSVFAVSSFDGNISSSEVALSPGSADDTTTVTLPSDAQVMNASMELTGRPYTAGGVDYPQEPALDIGADSGVDWAFRGTGFGAMGYQTGFLDGTKTAQGFNLSLGSGDEAVLATRLPANASLLRASMNVGGWPSPFWRDPAKVTPGTGSPGENSPVFFTAPDRLWIAWASKDPKLVDGPDWDIVVSWSFDGTSWARPVDISPAGDIFEDDSPDITAYDGKIYVAWSAAVNESQFSSSNIFIRSWDGTAWANAVRLTPPGLQYMNDWPQMEVYKGELYVFWRTTDPSLADISDSNDMDMVYRSSDGTAWAPAVELTTPDDTEIDWSLCLIKFDGLLYAFWDQDIVPGPGFSVDIFYRAFDGTSWSDPVDIIPPAWDGSPDSELDEIPKAAVYRDPVTGHDELWIAWIRGSPGTHDLRIMVRMFDGASWGSLTELTAADEHQDNMGQEILEYDGRLYVAWVTGTNTTEENNQTIAIYNTYGDVVIRAYDGNLWSDIMKLTQGTKDNANSPTLAVYNGKLYCGWAYPYPPASEGAKETWDIIVRNIDFRPVELELDVGNDGIVDWGPSELRSTNDNIPLYTDELQKALASAPRRRDEWGNEMCDIGIRVRSIYPCEVQLKNLSIEYSFTVRLDNLSGPLNALLNLTAGRGRSDGNITIPFQLSANSTGRMSVHDLNLTYIINRPPVLIEDIPDDHFAEDTTAVRLIDLEKYFWDDWDDGNLLFVVTFESDAGLIHATADGGYLTFTAPTAYWNGTARFRVRAFDRGHLWADSNLFNITVDHVNHPPVLDPIPDQNVDVGNLLYFEAHATDPDHDGLAFSSDEARFPLSPLDGEPYTAFVRVVTRQPGRFYVNVTVDDGHGGNDTRMVQISVRDKVSSTMNEPCATWLVIVAVAAAAAIGAEWYRRKYLKQTGPVMGPGGEYAEEEVFGGRVSAELRAAGIQGGSEETRSGRAEPPPQKVYSRSELAALRKKEAEQRITIPEKAVAADRAEEAKARKLRDEASQRGLNSASPPGEPERSPSGTGDGRDPLSEILRDK
jgi:hypothetical protein